MKLDRVKVCLYCADDFITSSDRRIYCSDRCKTRAFRDNMDCFYCGDLADSKDHITPHSTKGRKKRCWKTDTVRCCRDCNTLMSDAFPYNFSERIAYLYDKFVKKNKLDKPFVQWDDEDLEDVRGSLRSFIIDSQKKRQRDEVKASHILLTKIRVERFQEDVDIEDDYL